MTPTRPRILRIGAVLFGALLGIGTAGAHAQSDPAPRHPELRATFDAFGGKAGLVAIVDDFMAVLVDDPRTRAFFVDADQARIKAMLVEQFCVILDGPCTYTGASMRDAHAGLAIDEAAFNALTEDLQVAMDRHRVPFRAQNRLLAVLATMHRDIITTP